MAAISLPMPGTDLGPCEGKCEHRDCAATRLMAGAPCTICKKRIGYARRFFRFPNGEQTHALCLAMRDDEEEGKR